MAPKEEEIMKTVHLFLLSLFFVIVCWNLDAAHVQWKRMSSEDGSIPVPNKGDQQTCCVVFDIDNDGHDDFIVGERTKTPGVVWYRLRGKKFERHVIEAGRVNPEAGGAACDIDGDGDKDLILGQDASGNDIWWWENPNPHFDRPWKRRYIKKDGPRKHHDQSCADYDGDGRIEFLTWNQGANRLLLFEIPKNPQTAGDWKYSVVYTYKGSPQLEGFPSKPVDIDGDGTVDIVGGGLWFKRKKDGSFSAHEIDASMRFTQCAAGELVEGGRPEVVFSPGDTSGIARWYEWKNGKWIGHKLRYMNHGHTCEIRDVNGDGRDDLMMGEMGSPGAGDNAKTFIWYGDGKGGLKEQVAVSGQGIHEGLLGDFNGNGRLDLLVKPYHHKSPRIDVLLNQGVKK